MPSAAQVRRRRAAAISLAHSSLPQVSLTGFSVDDFLFRAEAIWPGQLPFGISCWVWRPTGANTGQLCTVGLEGQNNHRHTLAWVSNNVWAMSRDAGNSQAVTADGGAETWTPISGAWVTNSLREIRAGTTKDTDTVTRSPNAPDATYIGVRPDGQNPWDGPLAEFAFWDLAGFSEQDRDDLHDALRLGANPLTLNAQSGQPWSGRLITIGGQPAYASLRGPNGLGPFSMVGQLTEFSSRPPVDDPEP